MSWRTIISLAVSAALLTLLLLLGGSPRGPAGGSGRLLRMEGGAVNSVKLTRTGQVITLRRHDAGWRMEAPTRDRADRTTVEGLLAGVEFMRPLRWIPAGDAPPASGLSQPRFTLILGSGAGDLELQVGAADVSGEGVYVRVKEPSGARLAVAPARLVTLLDLQVSTLRDHQLVPLTPGVIRRVQFNTRPGQGVLERQGAGWVATSSGRPCRAATQRTRRLLNALSALRAQSITAPPDALASPWIKTTGSAGEEVILSRAGPCPGRADHVFLKVTERRAGKTARSLGACVEKPEVDALSPEPWTLQDLHLTGLSEPDLERISLKKGAKEKVLVRKPDGWTEAGQAGAVDGLTVRAWIKALREASGGLVAGTPGAEPEIRLVLTAEAGAVETLLFYPPSGQTMVVNRAGDGATLLLEPAVASRVKEVLELMAR